MRKIDNYFVISLDFGYVLHHCNVKKLLIYPHDINECVDLKGGLGKKDVFRMSSRRLQDIWKIRNCTSWKNEKLFRCRYLRGVFKTLWKATNVCWEQWYLQNTDIFKTRGIFRTLVCSEF